MSDQSADDAACENFELTYKIWQKYHRRAFGWNGPQGIVHAADLFELWDNLFFAFSPTEAELEEATNWMLSDPKMFDRSWESHFSWVKQRIMSERAEALKKNPLPLPVGTLRGKAWEESEDRKAMLLKIGRKRA